MTFTDVDDSFTFEIFDTYMAGLPTATLPLNGTDPGIVLQGGFAKQTPFPPFHYVTTVPSSSTDPGKMFDFTFDGVGNLYICYANNNWAKYANAGFGPASQTDAQPLGMP